MVLVPMARSVPPTPPHFRNTGYDSVLGLGGKLRVFRSLAQIAEQLLELIGDYGSLKIIAAPPPTGLWAFYFNDNSMTDLWLAATWGSQ
jgi:hypothetical protein